MGCFLIHGKIELENQKEELKKKEEELFHREEKLKQEKKAFENEKKPGQINPSFDAEGPGENSRCRSECDRSCS